MRRNRGYGFSYREETHRLRNFLVTLLVLLVFGVAFFITTNIIANHSVQLETYKITVHNLPRDLENWSILHLSDLHGVRIGEKQASIKEAIALKNYSCVVITGDMLGADQDTAPVLELLDLLPKDKPIFYLPGDEDPPLTTPLAHGSLSVYSEWAETLQRHGVTFLDEPLSITRGKSRIWFVPESLYTLDLSTMKASYTTQLEGLNARAGALSPDEAAQKRYIEYQLGRIDRIAEAKAAITTKDVQVAVSHAPVTASYLQTMLSWQDKSNAFSLRHAALVLAGHTCGGGWCLPGIGPIYVEDYGWFPGEAGIRGLHYLSGIAQYVSPGLGTRSSGLFRSRVFNPPTATLLYLTQQIQ